MTTTKAKAKEVTVESHITPRNIRKHKISDVFESVIWDVKAAVAAGFGIDMQTWGRETPSGKCYVCLGGSAIL